jgi:hypothetical protein
MLLRISIWQIRKAYLARMHRKISTGDHFFLGHLYEVIRLVHRITVR